MSSAETKLDQELARLGGSLLKKETRWVIPKENKVAFRVILGAISLALHEHAGLMCASVASAQRDLQHFSPLVLSLDKNLGILSFLSIKTALDLDFFLMALNAIIADSLRLILDEIGDVLSDQKLEGEAYFKAALPVLYKHAAGTSQVLFNGDSFSALSHLLQPKSIRVFEGILTPEEIRDFYDQSVQKYVRTIDREMRQLKRNEEIQKIHSQMESLGWEAKAKICAELAVPKLVKL